MHSSVHVLFVPGLTQALLDGGAMNELTQLALRARRAGLRCGFPSLPCVVESTVLTGVSPEGHGILGSVPWDDSIQRPKPWPGLVVERFPQIASALLRDGPRSAAVTAAARALDFPLARAVGAGSTVLLCGGPAAGAVLRQISLADVLESGDQARYDGAVARLRCETNRVDRLREALLATTGIERVLTRGESLASWGADHMEAGELVALAQRGASFEGGRGAFGHPEAEVDELPVVLAWGGKDEPAWPEEVHDLRLAPTLARHVASLPSNPPAFEDTALPW